MSKPTISVPAHILAPTTAENREVSLAEYKQIYASLPETLRAPLDDIEAAAAEAAQHDVLVIDVRGRDEYEHDRVSGVYANVPYKWDDTDFADAFDTEKTTAAEFKAKYSFDRPAKDKPIVVFCFSGARAANALAALHKLGYTHSKRFGGGYREFAWDRLPTEVTSPSSVTREVGFDTVRAIVESPVLTKQLRSRHIPALILDVRSRDEVKSDGRIPHSVNIPLSELDDALKIEDDDVMVDKYGIWAPNKDQPIVVACWSGFRAGKALDKLLAAGFTRAKIFRGSTREWNWRTLPAPFRNDGGDNNTADVSVPLAMLLEFSSHAGLMLLDVREPTTTEGAAVIPNAARVPASEVKAAFCTSEGACALDDEAFKAKYNFWRPDAGQPIVVLGASEADAAQAQQALVANGYAHVRMCGSGVDAFVKAVQQKEQKKE